MLGSVSGFLSIVSINATPTVIYLTTGDSSPWTVPADFNFVNNKIELFGAGGGGAGTTASSNQATGGAGGTYGQLNNLLLSPGSTVTFAVGTGGSGGTTGSGANGGNTWFNGSSLASCSVGAQGGQGGTRNANGGVSGGIWVGVAGFAGGAGGNVSQRSATASGSGGGSAGGLHGVGGRGGNENISSPAANFALGGTGGGGSDGGTNGDDNLITGAVSANGTAGGTGQDGTAGGAKGVVSTSNGSAGSHGSGGGGGGGDYYTHAAWKGGIGGDGLGYTQTSNSFIAGPGGGGGGGGGYDFNAPSKSSVHYLAQGSSGTFRDYFFANSAVAVWSDTSTVSFWLKYSGVHRTTQSIIFAASYYRCYANTGSGVINFDGGTGTDNPGPGASFANTFKLNSSVAIDDGTWHHIAACWNRTTGTSSFKLYIDDVNVRGTVLNNPTITTPANSTFQNWGFNTIFGGTPTMDMELSDFWYSLDYFDISNTTNRRKFISAALEEVYLGANGEIPTGASPHIYLGNPAATYSINLGTGPDLVPQQSTIVSDSVSPPPNGDVASALNPGAGGNGGRFGGGGGGAGRSSNTTNGAAGGTGANGLIIITYNGRIGG